MANCEFDVPAGRDVECGWLEVPEDRSDLSKGTISLHVAVFSSESESPAPDPIVYLEGGPGGEILEAIPLVFEDRFAHLLADRDLIVFDQRGTGFSRPSLACPELRDLGLELLEQDLPPAEVRELELGALAECRDRLIEDGADLDAYSSLASAADLEDLRTALGIAEWNIYGISYGTRLALTAMRSYPDGIRSVVLDSVLPPEVDLYAEAAGNLDRALGELFSGCAEDDVCSSAYPNLESDFYQLLDELEIDPVVAPVSDVFTGETYQAVVDGATLGGVVFQALYSEDAIPIIPSMIDNIRSGETYELSVLLTSFLANGEFVSAGMQFSVQCAEEVTFTSAETIEGAFAEYPELDVVFDAVSNLGPGIFEICDLWEAGDVPPSENGPVTSDIPALVLAGEYDPITPPRWSESIASNLDNSTYVYLPGVGHGPSGSVDCAQSILLDFIADPSDPVDTSCTSTLSGPEWATDDIEPPEVELVEFSHDFVGVPMSGVVPEGWEEVAPGTWARQADGFDQTTLVQQGVPGATRELLIGSLAAQLGFEADAQPDETYDDWDLYEVSLGGVPATVAVTDSDAGALIVILLTSPQETEVLRDSVLFPALDEIQIR